MRFTPMLSVLALVAVPALAQQGGMQGMSGGGTPGLSQQMMDETGNPYAHAEMDMHARMMAARQGDAAEMWTRKMIEHHRGAIAMSRVALREARDPATRRLATMNITEQEKSVAQLQSWLRANGKAAQ